MMLNILSKFILLLVFCGITSVGSAFEKVQYPVADIAANLKVNADVVIRDATVSVEALHKQIKSKYTRVTTVLNERGKSAADLYIFYTSFDQVSAINGYLYDKDGKLLKTMPKKDVSDISTFGSSFSFHDDLRVKSYGFAYNQYPYTVRYEYEIKTSNSFYIPDWTPINRERLAVEKSRMTLSFNPIDSIKFKTYQLSNPILSEPWGAFKNNVYNWEVNNLQSIKLEPQSATHYTFPKLSMSPVNMNLGNYSGLTNTWAELGKFIYEINKERDVLPAEQVAIVQKLIVAAKDDKEKIAILYQYLQGNTRYVANEYGISGWQTFEAKDVAKTGYGDCKGLSNYMKAMLASAGIKSYLTLVNGGDASFYRIDADFVTNQFNHMILCVPLEKDTVWLECTSRLDPAGYLGSFTQNRYALVLTPEGGNLVRTPNYNKNNSFVKRVINIDLSTETEHFPISWNTTYSGILQEHLQATVKAGAHTKLKKNIASAAPFLNLEILEMNYTEGLNNKGIPTVEEKLLLKGAHFLEASTKRLYVNIPLELDLVSHLDIQSDRTLPFYIDRDLQYDIVYKLKLPSGYKLESLPQDSEHKGVFGTFSKKIEVVGDECTVAILLSQNEGVYPLTQFKPYQEMVKTTRQYLKNIELTLVKN